MSSLHSTVRAIVAAASLALAAVPTPAFAQLEADVAPDGATVTSSLDGRTITALSLPPVWLDALADGRATATLRAAGSETGLPTEIDISDGVVRLTPRFPAIRGIAHRLEIATATDRLDLPVVSDVPAPAPARVVGLWPDAPVLPENTLRLYVTFDAPMARGVTEHIHLETPDGVRLDDSFLNLATELWSPDQTRLTLLLDPGRIKQGVGPNIAIGAPLDASRFYRLVVDAEARDALGRPLAAAFSHAFETGPALRDAIDPAAWQIDAPAPGATEPLTVAFGRPMDRAIAARAIQALDPEGRPLSGQVAMTDTTWSLTPDAPWPAAPTLRIAPILEDVAGNTICQPFDVAAGRAVPCTEAVVLETAVSPPGE